MLADLQRDGVVRLPPLANFEAAFIRGYLRNKPQYDGHIHGFAPGLGYGQPARDDSTQVCWAMNDVLQAPHVVELALAWMPLVQEYLGEPLLYSVNAFTMYPSEGATSPDTQEFHRDKDDSRFVGLFCYLTDVETPEDGAHQFKRGTHHGFHNGEMETIVGPAGTMFLADTRGRHRGVRPARKPRTILWIRWGVSDPPPSYQWCGLKPCDKALIGDRYPSDPLLQRQIRLVLA